MTKVLVALVVITSALPMSHAADDLPEAIDLLSELPPVGDQGDVLPGSSTSACWAAAYYQLTQYIKHFHHPEWDLADSRHQFSPAFLNYWQGDPYSSLQSMGCVDMAEFPYDPDFGGPGPTAAQIEAAKPYRITSYTAVWNNLSDQAPFTNSQELIDSAREWLATGHVLSVGIEVGPDFPDYASGASSLAKNPPAHFYDPESVAVGLATDHQVAFCGYDDNVNPAGTSPDHRGGFLMVNCWGTNWNGDMHGYLWMSYAYVKRYVSQCIVINGVNADAPSMTSCSAKVGKAGDIIQITGNNFGTYRRASAVTFDGIPATQVNFVNDAIAVVIPGGAPSGPLVAYNWEGAPSDAVDFTVVPPVTLTVTMLGGDVVLRATGPAGRSLQFSTSTNLIDWDTWVLAPNPSGTTQVTDPTPSAAQKYYRAELR
jgi:C1A family cysteine protease